MYNKEILFCIIDKSNKKVEYKNKEYNFERKYIEISRLVSLGWINILMAFFQFWRLLKIKWLIILKYETVMAN